MKESILKLQKTALFVASFVICVSINAQSPNSGKKAHSRPLKNINYMAVNGRIGAGFSPIQLNTDNNWSTTSGIPLRFGAGFNFVLKNSWGFDLQISEEIVSHQVSNIGPSYKTGYMATGAEIGVKKNFTKKKDDSFYFRAAFGYNFLIISNKSGGDDYYTYNSSANGSNMYILPEFGYQLRLPSPRHLFNFSVNYKYSLSEIANSNMLYTDKGNANESNTLSMTGTSFGVNVSYIFILKGFENIERKDVKIDSHF